jgi:hypothetical protein
MVLQWIFVTQVLEATMDLSIQPIWHLQVNMYVNATKVPEQRMRMDLLHTKLKLAILAFLKFMHTQII